MSTPDPPGHRLPGIAALSRADVADAKRRRPAVDLRAYARRHGLATGSASFVPGDPALRFNVLCGPIAQEPEAALFHWAKPWGVFPDGDPGPGTFHARRWRPARGPWWKLLKPDLTWLSWLPFVGWLFALKQVDTGAPAQPNAIGVPCTAVAVAIPEAAGLRAMTIDNWPKPRHIAADHERLGGRGLPGWTALYPQGAPPAQVVDRFLSEPVLGALAAVSATPFFELRFRDGVLVVARNGYLDDPAELDALAATAALAAAALRATAFARA